MKIQHTFNKFALTLAALALLINPAFSQDNQDDDMKVEIRGYVMFGGGQMENDELNTRMTDAGYKAFSQDFGSIGLGFLQKYNDKWLFGAEGHFLAVEEQMNTIESGTYKSSLAVGCGFLDFGYVLASTGKLDVYPLVGIGIAGGQLSIGENDFNSILEDPKSGASMSSVAFAMNFAIGADYMFKSKQEDAGFVVGVRAGYMVVPGSGSWMWDLQTIDNGPEIGMTGPYLRLMIGLGGGKSFWEEK